MVVDDQHSRAQAGTSAASVVPLVSLDSTVNVPSSSSIRSRIPTRPMPVAALGRVESAAVVLDHGPDPPIDARDEHADPLARACLTTFVSASWTIR